MLLYAPKSTLGQASSDGYLADRLVNVSKLSDLDLLTSEGSRYGLVRAHY